MTEPIATDRLRALAGATGHVTYSDALRDAADEIDRLRAGIEVQVGLLLDDDAYDLTPSNVAVALCSLLSGPIRTPEVGRTDLSDAEEPTSCPHGDTACPCQDGDPCHYAGPDPMRCPVSGTVGCVTCTGEPTPEPPITTMSSSHVCTTYMRGRCETCGAETAPREPGGVFGPDGRGVANNTNAPGSREGRHDPNHG